LIVLILDKTHKTRNMNLLSKLATVTVVLLSFSSFAAGISFQEITLSEALQKAKTENKPIFIDVYATWCGPCKYLSREVFVDEELGDFMNEHFINLKLDGEKGDGQSIMIEFGLDAYPTMLFISAEKQELNRIVGAVGAAEILQTSKGVVDPTSTAVYKMREDYEAGNRDKTFLQEYISELLNSDEEYEGVVDEYLQLFPELDLSDESDFLIFCLGITDIDHPLNAAFLNDIETHHGAFPEMTQAKISMLIYGICEEAKESGKLSLIDDGVAKLTAPLNKILEETVTENDLKEVMLEAVQE